MYRFFVILFLTVWCTTASAETTKAFDGHTPSIAEIKQLQQQAKAEGKKLLLILGADWCHDSQALIKQFESPAFTKQLEQAYVVQRYDVGYLTRGEAITQHFGEPTYYGTPTVMIIDPTTDQVLNKADWQHWTNAASHSATEFEDYFLGENYRPLAPTAANRSFETQQAKRVQAGFAVAGPLLEAYKESAAERPPAEFMQVWSELARFRNQVFNDVVDLHAATDQFPSYPPLSWEKE